mmetsp:Transcript_27313/g.86124  ORF Transcript_27313/g.86124 Transcript_27313/m.86124 type:complete len:222 (-) Transcript_27313:8-673(-)
MVPTCAGRMTRSLSAYPGRTTWPTVPASFSGSGYSNMASCTCGSNLSPTAPYLMSCVGEGGGVSVFRGCVPRLGAAGSGLRAAAYLVLREGLLQLRLDHGHALEQVLQLLRRVRILRRRLGGVDGAIKVVGHVQEALGELANREVPGAGHIPLGDGARILRLGQRHPHGLVELLHLGLEVGHLALQLRRRGPRARGLLLHRTGLRLGLGLGLGLGLAISLT